MEGSRSRREAHGYVVLLRDADGTRSSPSAPGHTEPHPGPLLVTTHLDEVAELVRHPEAPSTRLVWRRSAAADQGVLDPASVLEVADEGAVFVPDAEGAGAAAMADAVGGGWLCSAPRRTESSRGPES
jgi:hypothetical protein